jgi:exodeoxyribonuclease VII large subunit
MNPPRGVVSVAELDRRLRRAVEAASGSDWVQGEVRGLQKAGSGHAYFTLRDEREDAALDCVMYRSQQLRAGRFLVEGACVQALGRATVWAPRGRLQFVVESLQPVGRGALLEALDRLKAKLAAEGLFAAERKRPLPKNPRCIGVVTSAHGAAWHDIQAVALRRSALKLVLAPALVQGDGAAESIMRALRLLERYPGLDAIIIGRGGGSLEDLMAFNDERVVRRVAASSVPIVSAVGHEIDTSLCDLVADARAATPSEAAERLVPDRLAQARELRTSVLRLRRAMRDRLREDRGALAALRAKLGDPRFVIADQQQSLDDLSFRLERCVRAALRTSRQRFGSVEQRLQLRHPRAVVLASKAQLVPLRLRLEHATGALLLQEQRRQQALAARLNDLSPVAVLARGYAIVLNEEHKAIRDSAEVSAGQRLQVRVHRGSFSAEVVEQSEETEAGKWRKR